MFVSRDFSFEAAHNLINYYGVDEPLHGHTWKIRVTLQSTVKGDGMAYDFVKMSEYIKTRVVDKLDHKYVNDVVAQPSAENIAIWAWAQLLDTGMPLHEIIVWETGDAFVVYQGPRAEAELKLAQAVEVQTA